MKYKPDWPEAERRWTALWNHEPTDRPVMTVRAPNGRRVDAPPAPPSFEAKWLDPDYILPAMRAQFESTYWGGESLPSSLLMGQWVAMAHGAAPVFEPQTIWFETIAADYEAAPDFRLDEANLWLAKAETLYARALAMAEADDFMVGTPPLLPANDMLSMFLGPDEFLLQLLDHPTWMREALAQLAANHVAIRKRFAALARPRHRFWYGNAGWANFWAPVPFFSTQSDVSCMISPAMFREFILPEIDAYAGALGPIWYHLDGLGAECHLPALLARDYVRVVQWVPAPSQGPNGPAHLPLYRQIQDAGRIVHIAIPKGNVEAVIRELDPALLCLEVGCASVAEAQELLLAAKRWTCARAAAVTH